MDSLTHKSNSREISQLLKITLFLPQNESIHEKVISADVRFTSFVLEHNLPPDVADHVAFGPLYSVPCFSMELQQRLFRTLNI